MVNYEDGETISPRDVATQMVVKFKLASLIKLRTRFRYRSKMHGHDQ